MQSPPFVFFSCSGPSARTKVRVAKKHSALGLHCLFHVRTSGDIKGPLRGLSLCISSAPTVCAQDPGMRSVFHLITPRLKALVGAGKQRCPPHLPAVFFARAYVCGLFKKNCQHPPPLPSALLCGGSMQNHISIVRAVLT